MLSIRSLNFDFLRASAQWVLNLVPFFKTENCNVSSGYVKEGRTFCCPVTKDWTTMVNNIVTNYR